MAGPTPLRTRLARHRRRYVILGVIVAIHLAALAAYAIQTRQSSYLALVLDAREQWSEGHLDLAAASYRQFAADYPSFSWPTILFRDYPSRARAWYSLGRVESERGNVDAALAAYTEAMREEAGLGQREYRNLLFEQARYRELAAFAQARIAAGPDELSAYFDLGAAEIGASDWAAAQRTYAAALGHVPAWLARHTRHGPGPGLGPEEADLRDLSAVTALLAGDRGDAERRCAALSRRQGPGEHYDQLCRAYLVAAAGDRDAARAALRGYSPGGPEHERLAALLAVPPGPASPPR